MSEPVLIREYYVYERQILDAFVLDKIWWPSPTARLIELRRGDEIILEGKPNPLPHEVLYGINAPVGSHYVLRAHMTQPTEVFVRGYVDLKRVGYVPRAWASPMQPVGQLHVVELLDPWRGK